MNYAFLPDLTALAILIAILLLMRRRHPQVQADVWILGLFITLVESLAHIFYSDNGLPARGLHVIVLDCYLLAGMVFTWDARRHPNSIRTRLIYLGLNGLPLFAINTTYGLHIYNRAAYLPWVVAGLLIAAGSSIVFPRRPRLVTIVHIAGWIAIGALVYQGKFRDAVYWSLAGVYLVAGLKFRRRLPSPSTGRLAILTGFFIWSFCFFLHPFIVHYRTYADIASHIWNMQKSLISIGMILVMLEEQVSCNRWLALHDELTGLPNRRAFEDHLALAFERCRRDDSTLALFLFDLDGFKQINDTFGHAAGDQLLKHIALSLCDHVRGFDSLARLGGDEFALLWCNPGRNYSVERISEIIAAAVERPLLFDEHSLKVSASIGIALYPEDAADPTRLARVADLRMYALKQTRTPIRHIRLDSIPAMTASGRFRRPASSEALSKPSATA